MSYQTYSNRTLVALVIAGLATITVLWFKHDAASLVQFINNSLWAEDGVVFISEAEQYGIGSIWKEYAGYIHLYPRLFALLASRLDPTIIPWIYMFGFAFAVLIMMFLVARSLLELNVSVVWVIVASTLVGLQPNHGQIFYTLTNSQWFLAVGLCALVSIPRLYASSHWYTLLGGLISLTGPFSVLVLPVMLVRFAVDRRFDMKSIIFPLVMTICVVVQILYIVSSGRGSEPFNDNWRAWLVVLYESATFGAVNHLVIGLSLVIWPALAAALGMTYRDLDAEKRDNFIAAILLLASGVFMYIGALWGFKNAAGGLNPMLGNARYFFSPYGMVVLAMIVLFAYAPIASRMTVALFALISLVQFKTVSRPDLQYLSFIEMSKVKEGVVVPIAPQISEFPGWHFTLGHNYGELPDYQTYTFVGSEMEQLVAVNESVVQLHLDGLCSASKHLGLVVSVHKSTDSQTKIFWGEPMQSLTRFYPAGLVELQYALPISGSSTMGVELDLGEPFQMLDMKSVQVLCMGQRD